MKHLEDLIKEKKPNISSSSITTYISLLKTIYYLKHHTKDITDISWFNNQDEIIEMMKDRPASSRKTTYSALVAVAKDNDKYKQALMEDGKTYQKFIEKQEKTETQQDNWKDYAEIKSVYDKMHLQAKPLLNSKEPLTDKDRLTLQNFIIVCLTTGIWIPPRRSTDWTKFKIKGDISQTEDNFMTKNEFVFNQYKTSKFYHEQKVEIPKGLKTILNKWVKKTPYDYLLTDIKGKPLTNVRLAQILNGIFDAKISTSMLRHIYLSDKLKNVPSLKDLKQTAEEMGHSVKEALEYVKH
jgi:hypothetical protein